MNVKITGEEKNKSEIIYNNIVDTMEEMDLTKDEQVEYLKNKVASLEVEIHSKMILACTVLAGVVGIALGLYFVAIDQYLFGVVLSFGTLFMMLYKMHLTTKTSFSVRKDNNYDRIEKLRKMLNMKLK